MMQIPVTIIDAADIRAFECLLPTTVPVSRIAARLAELLHLPLIGSDGRPLDYGLVAKGGLLLNSDASLADQNLPNPLLARLVPEISAAGADEIEQAAGRAADRSGLSRAPLGFDEDDDDDSEVVVGMQTRLISEDDPGAKSDLRIDVEVHRQIEAFASANPNVECAGLLLGTVETERRTRIIHITAAAPAEGAIGTRASVNISLSDWETMYRTRDLDHPDLRILGWFHTHAGWGVFMSESDVFIHRHFFAHPSMAAYVLDPTTGRDGFFCWHEDKIGLCPSYGLVGHADDLDTGAHHSRKPQSEHRNQRRIGRKAAPVAVGLLLLAGLGFGGRSLIPHLASRPAKHVPSVVVTTEQASPDRMYTISRRDNPWKICNRVYDNGDLAMALMRYNGLSNVSGLQIGQQIKLPPKETLQKLAEEL